MKILEKNFRNMICATPTRGTDDQFANLLDCTPAQFRTMVRRMKADGILRVRPSFFEPAVPCYQLLDQREKIA